MENNKIGIEFTSSYSALCDIMDEFRNELKDRLYLTVYRRELFPDKVDAFDAYKALSDKGLVMEILPLSNKENKINTLFEGQELDTRAKFLTYMSLNLSLISSKMGIDKKIFSGVLDGMGTVNNTMNYDKLTDIIKVRDRYAAIAKNKYNKSWTSCEELTLEEFTGMDNGNLFPNLTTKHILVFEDLFNLFGQRIVFRNRSNSYIGFNLAKKTRVVNKFNTMSLDKLMPFHNVEFRGRRAEYPIKNLYSISKSHINVQSIFRLLYIGVAVSVSDKAINYLKDPMIPMLGFQDYYNEVGKFKYNDGSKNSIKCLLDENYIHPFALNEDEKTTRMDNTIVTYENSISLDTQENFYNLLENDITEDEEVSYEEPDESFSNDNEEENDDSVDPFDGDYFVNSRYISNCLINDVTKKVELILDNNDYVETKKHIAILNEITVRCFKSVRWELEVDKLFLSVKGTRKNEVRLSNNKQYIRTLDYFSELIIKKFITWKNKEDGNVITLKRKYTPIRSGRYNRKTVDQLYF